MGHSHQAISLLVNAGSSAFAVPLVSRIHEGIVTSNRDTRTQHDKMINLLQSIDMPEPFYFVADAFYANQKIIAGLLGDGNHLVTRVKNNAVGYTMPKASERRKRGRPPKYGERVPLPSIRHQPGPFHKAPSPIYGDHGVTIKYRTRDLLWKPAGRLVRFVIVEYPRRGHCLLMSTDLSLSALQIIELYGLRFKIEHGFKQAKGVVGSYGYHSTPSRSSACRWVLSSTVKDNARVALETFKACRSTCRDSGLELRCVTTKKALPS